MDFHLFTRLRYVQTIFWTMLVCAVVVTVAAVLARATLNLNAALVEKPDLAVYVLRPDVVEATLVRETDLHRDYIAKTAAGTEFIELTFRNQQWEITKEEMLHE